MQSEITAEPVLSKSNTTRSCDRKHGWIVLVHVNILMNYYMLKEAEEKGGRNKPSVLVALINFRAMLRLKMAVAPSTIPPTTLFAVPNMPPAIPRTPPLAVAVISLKSNTFLVINTTVPFIL